jgi:hypothetical protein
MGRFSQVAVASAVILFCLILLIVRLRKDLDDEAHFVISTAKICQLTGVEDRERPGKPTGQLLGGDGAGVTGSDLGYPFEHRDRLYFLFGDTRETDPHLCEPALCGTKANPKPLGVPGLHLARLPGRLEL